MAQTEVIYRPAEAARSVRHDSRRSLTFRAVLLGFCIACVSAVIANYHDGSITKRELSLQDYTAPLSVGLLLIVGVFGNALLYLVRRQWALRAGELGVALALILMVAPLSRYYVHGWVGTVGYTPALINARHKDMGDLNKINVYQILPPGSMLSREDSVALDRSKMDAKEGGTPLSAIPWRAWQGPMLYWAPLLLVFLVFSMSFGYTLYQQWAYRELVSFPLAELSAAMIANKEGRALPDIFYRASFWIACGLMIGMFTINGLKNHFEKMIEIPLNFRYDELRETFKFLDKAIEGYSLLRGLFYFTMIAVAVLLPAELSFTSWVTWPLVVIASYFYYLQVGEKFGQTQCSIVNIGSFWAMALLILYAGRTYYVALVRRAIGLGSPESVDHSSLWVFRVFLASAAAFTALLVIYGIPIDLAILWTLGTIILFLVVCRLVTEMGIPWTPLSGMGPLNSMLLALGESALGTRIYGLMSIFSSLTTPTIVTNNYFAPAVLNAAHVESKLTGGNPLLKVIVPFSFAVLLFCIGAAIYMGYNSRGATPDYHAKPYASSIGEVRNAGKKINEMLSMTLNRTPKPEDVSTSFQTAMSFRERWSRSNLRPQTGFVGFFTLGFVLVLGTGMARLKFARFPFHPLPLVLLGSWLLSRYWYCFLVGWLIKKGLLKIGGARLFELSRPFLVGIVFGQVLIFLAWVVVDIVLFNARGFTLEPKLWKVLQDVYSS